MIADLSGEEGVAHLLRVAQLAAHAQLTVRGGERQVTPGGQPGGRVVGTIERPGLVRIEGGHGPHGDRLEAIELPVQGHQRLAVGQGGRLQRHELIQRLRQLGYPVGAQRHGSPRLAYTRLLT